ncbi:MAG: AraC family transcriptional regulator [Panacagrimonas sp.]|nr:AraC family transcriptional regulator [Panacagrimonas sp.]MCC2656410.1 AraC family transcriptional regulator [Panacagrimonas sp.]
MPGNFVRSALLSGADALIRELGGKPLAIARRAGVPAEALRDGDIPLPGRAAYDFLECAAQMCDCRTFGLRLGSRTQMAVVIGPLWVLLRSAGTVGQMFEDLAANFDVYTSVATMAIEKLRDGGMIVSWSSTSGQTESEVQMAELALAVCVQEIRRQTGTQWHPPSVGFRHAAPRELGEFHALFGPHVGFNRDRNTIVLEQELVERPLATGAARTRSLVGALLRRQDDVMTAGIDTRVESVVRAVLPFAPCTLRDVAQSLGMPVRTLQHRLDADGQSFKRIKDRVRADLAMKYLRHSQLGLGEIAEILGYSEPSAFSRSFRRWHGRPASAVRREARSG